MHVRPLDQTSFFDPHFLVPDALVRGSVPWLLAHEPARLFPAWLFMGWRGSTGRGRKAWPARVLMALVVLRWTEEGMSRLASTRRAKTDLVWRAAMGLPVGNGTPHERTIRDFERFMRSRHPEAGAPRFVLFHEHVVRLCLEAGVAGPEATWAMDSTPMWCFGAVRDTLRLLGEGTRTLLRDWATGTRSSLDEVAHRLDVPFVLAKSIKGAFDINWKDPAARSSVVARVADSAVDAVTFVRRHIADARPSHRRRILRTARQLAAVVANDLEADESGRLGVARRVATDRIVSMTDPTARHGRKSASARFDGFKVSLLGDIESGLIAAVTVHPGNTHDGSVAHRIVRRAKRLVGSIERVLGDTAYGGARLRFMLRESEGVSVLAPPVPVAAGARFGRERFDFDLDAGTATCPAGKTTDRLSWNTSGNCEGTAAKAPTFIWSADDCGSCPMASRCHAPHRRSRRVRFHPYETDLRRARSEWKTSAARSEYRKRSRCERLVHRMVRHGARRARAWGLGAANFQAHAVATACNLGLLAQALAAG